jgi:hypothetical protein
VYGRAEKAGNTIFFILAALVHNPLEAKNIVEFLTTKEFACSEVELLDSCWNMSTTGWLAGWLMSRSAGSNFDHF